MDQKLGGHHVFAYHNPVNLPFAQEYQILMFVYLWFFVPLENVWLIWRRHHYQWKAEIFYLYSHLGPLSSKGFWAS